MFKLFPYLFILSCFYCACNAPKPDYETQVELQYLDTLNDRLLGIKTLLDKVDLADIEERSEVIEHNLQFCSIKMEEKAIEPDEEMKRLFEEYRALDRLYLNTAKQYTAIVKQTEELFIQIKTLKESAKEKDYDKVVFKVYFNQAKKEILSLNSLAQNTLKLCVESESVFTRRQEEVETLAEALKK
ncbi:MAG: hypothetical protein PSX81_06880 [bacterium]|nr:hypothetical protein [bacterium]